MSTRVSRTTAALDDEFDLTGWHLGRLSPMPSRIPDGWRLVRLTSVARLESGHTPSRRHPEYWDGSIPWISLHDTDNLESPEIVDTAQTVGLLGLQHSSARLLPKGTVVFSRTATVGKATVMGREMTTSQDFANYVCGPRLYNHYLRHLFRFMTAEWERLMAGSTHNSIYMPVFQELRILLPPIREQKAIAAALDDCDSLISGFGQLLAKKRLIKQGALDVLLSGQRRIVGFDAGWTQIRLGELFTFKNGLNKAKRFFGHGTPIVNYMDVFRRPRITSNDLVGKVSLTNEELKNFDVRKGDVFFTRTSETREDVGVASVVLDDPVNTVFSGFVLRGRPKDARLHDGFKAYCFQSREVRRQIVSSASYTTRALTNGKALSAVNLLVPPLDEQAAIAAVLMAIDGELVTIEQKVAKARQIKQGMMQNLLTGKIRLV